MAEQVITDEDAGQYRYGKPKGEPTGLESNDDQHDAYDHVSGRWKSRTFLQGGEKDLDISRGHQTDNHQGQEIGPAPWLLPSLKPCLIH